MGEKIGLSVKKSGIAGSGIARIHSDAARRIGIKSGETIEIWKGKKWIMAKAVADRLVGKKEVSLRPGDMKKLSVKEEEKVTLSEHIPVKRIVKKKVKILKKKGESAGKKIKKRAEKIAKKLMKKTKSKK